MRLKNITLEGFQSYTEREFIDLEDLSLVAVVGPNGAGKTTMLNGIEFALFGKFRGDAINSVISRGAKQAEVIVQFELSGDTYKIRRVKGSNRHEVYLNVRDDDMEDGWRVLQEKHPSVVDSRIRDLIGMDYETARTTWLIGQNDFGAFCELKPSPRRAVLTNAFGLNRYVELAERADTNLKQSQAELSEVRVKLDQVLARRTALESEVADPELHPLTDAGLEEEEKRIEGEDEKVTSALSVDLGDVESLQQHLATAEQNLRETLAAHEREVSRHAEDVRRAEKSVAQAQSAVTQAQGNRDAAASAAWMVEDAKEDMESSHQRVATVEEAIPGLREVVMKHANAISAHAAKMESAIKQGHEINDRLATLNRTAHGHEGECFACGQALSEERAQSMLQQLEKEKVELKAEHDASQQAQQQAVQDKGAAEQEVKKAESALREAQRAMSRAEQEHRDAERASQSLPQLEELLSAATKQLSEATQEQEAVAGVDAPVLDEQRVQSLRLEASEAEQKLRDAKESSGNRQQLRAQRDSLRSRQKRVWAEQQRRERVSKEIADLDGPQKEFEGKVAAIEKDVVTYQALREAFRPAGIPAMILAGVVEELNDDANDVLMDLGGQFGVNVTTQRENASGGVEEKVMIYVTTPEGEIDYTTLSGSERFRCALALRIALARCIARRTGTPIETIIMDEGWGALDEEYRKAVQDVLVELSTDFSVYTVSHIDEIKAAFPTVIEVNKDEGTSRAEVLSR